MPSLQPGEKVWVKDIQTTGLIKSPTAEPRSYEVQTRRGKVRRNRKHLILSPNAETNWNDEIGAEQEDIEIRENQPQSPVDKNIQESQEQTRTRSGRIIVPPQRLNL